MQKYPALANEYKEFKPLTWSTDPVRIMVSDRPVHVPNDIKGVKVGGEGTAQDVVREAGGVPVMTVPPDTYMAMQNKVINASLSIGWNHVQTYKLWEVANYILDYGFGHGGTNLYMNNKSWASLPPDVQKVMTDLLPELNTRCDQGLQATADAGKKSAIDNKCTVYVPTAAEAALWEKVKAPIEDAWLAEMKSKGVTSAPDILKDVKQAQAKAQGK
jgi:TRAP-type C4-dicarboxylate transport system substrate-binding protein